MPSFDIVRQTSPKKKTFRVASVLGKFDIRTAIIRERFQGNIDIEGKDWNIGVIYGASGTGKSTIARELFPKEFHEPFKYEAESVLDDMPKNCSVEDVTKMFNAVGFSSPPSWLKPYSVLSNGEKMRVDLARAILQDQKFIVFDEFTSVVDRQVAKIGSLALQKAVRRMGKQFVAVTCHKDVLEWLQPDWEFCTDTMSFFLRKNGSARTSRSRSILAAPKHGKPFASITI